MQTAEKTNPVEIISQVNANKGSLGQDLLDEFVGLIANSGHPAQVVLQTFVPLSYGKCRRGRGECQHGIPIRWIPSRLHFSIFIFKISFSTVYMGHIHPSTIQLQLWPLVFHGLQFFWYHTKKFSRIGLMTSKGKNIFLW